MWLKPPWLLTTTTRHVILEEVLSGVGGGEMGIPGFDDLFPEFGANAALESYSYMDAIVNTWNEIGILKDIMQHKLVFIETQDVVETTLALHNYRKACDCGRGLRGNSLSGTLSPDICQLTRLWYFDVRGNNLTETIPDSIGNCTSFEILDISYNEITGEIPYNIGFLQVATL
ncbi:hypothetical protein Droror1_Dr00019976 [Drosera rotundifolia]